MKYTEVNPFTGKNIDEDAPANATGPSVAGTGDYDVNASASLLATANSGYVFSQWTGDAVGSATSLARGEAPLYLSQPSLHSILILPSRGAHPMVRKYKNAKSKIK